MRIVLATLLLALIAASGCNFGSGNQNSNSANRNTAFNFNAPSPLVPEGSVPADFTPCNPYFPLVPNSVVKYSLSFSSGLVGNTMVVVKQREEAGRKVYYEQWQTIDQQTGGMEQIQSIEKKYVCDGERIQIITERTDTKVQGNPTSSVFNYRPDSLFLTDPTSLLTPGTKWSYSQVTTMIDPGKSPVTSNVATVVQCEVKGEEEIQTPLGKFKAVKVEKTVNTNKMTEYYVKGLGMVRRETGEGSRVEMKEFSGLQPMP
jgi:hypothetical protein